MNSQSVDTAIQATLQQISYNVRQAHLATGIGESTLRKLVREGHLAARYLGSTLLIDADDLKRLFASLPSEKQVDRDVAANRGVA
ncbi:helix-turn-helix domain-containing protein [Nocardia sp. NBC_00565]|uniref:helix-turn-helix domain-containing protein n=1 Tax=Nocardia sp. NBC_00565 TaxID=2975993 RepID=UPI002E808356|nr:helix-turn-helix domain-containing protein [Nocardia sp. NBC_00565]WUC03638.1 helix-turn-helix domain-containing protein [Nocardia sp. NBC_00565]